MPTDLHFQQSNPKCAGMPTLKSLPHNKRECGTQAIGFDLPRQSPEERDHRTEFSFPWATGMAVFRSSAVASAQTLEHARPSARPLERRSARAHVGCAAERRGDASRAFRSRLLANPAPPQASFCDVTTFLLQWRRFDPPPTSSALPRRRAPVGRLFAARIVSARQSVAGGPFSGADARALHQRLARAAPLQPPLERACRRACCRHHAPLFPFARPDNNPLFAVFFALSPWVTPVLCVLALRCLGPESRRAHERIGLQKRRGAPTAAYVVPVLHTTTG